MGTISLLVELKEYSEGLEMEKDISVVEIVTFLEGIYFMHHPSGQANPTDVRPASAFLLGFAAGHMRKRDEELLKTYGGALGE